MENSSTSPPSPAWPTRWPQDAFRPGGIAAVLGLILAALAAGVILAVIVAQFVAPSFAATRRIDGIWIVVLSALAEIFVPVAVLIALPRAARLSLPELGFRRPDLRAVGIALAGVICGVILVTLGASAVSALTHTGDHSQQTERLFLALRAPWQIGIFAFFAAILAPVVEESVFRLFVFNVGLRYGGFWTGAILSSILFGLAHGDPYNAFPLALVGVVLCGVYYLTRNAYASMIAHGAFNLLTLVALEFFPKVAGG